MTIQEFFESQHAVQSESCFPKDLAERADCQQFLESRFAMEWVEVVASNVLRYSETEVQAVIQMAFMFGMRCGRVVPE